MQAGDYIETPRFLTVKIKAVYPSETSAVSNGYTEPTHYVNNEYGILGKSAGTNMMIFAAFKRKAV